MANKIYPEVKAAMMSGDLALDTDNLVAILVDTAAYTYSDTHTFLSEIPAVDRIATSANLTGKVINGANFDSDDLVWTSVTGDTSEAVILVQDSGNPATSRLIVYVDTGITELPITPNGGDINVAVNANGWFDL